MERVTERADRCDDQAEHRQCDEFWDGAGRSQHEGRAEGDEVAGDVGGEQTLQCEEAGCVDIAGVDAEQDWERGFHGARAWWCCSALSVLPTRRLSAPSGKFPCDDNNILIVYPS